MSNIHEKFHVASKCKKNLKYQIESFCYNLFLSYADNRCTDKQIHIHIPRLIAESVIFLIQGTSKRACLSQSLDQKFHTTTIHSLLYMGKRI